jgi:hypothetical protein
MHDNCGLPVHAHKKLIWKKPGDSANEKGGYYEEAVWDVLELK